MEKLQNLVNKHNVDALNIDQLCRANDFGTSVIVDVALFNDNSQVCARLQFNFPHFEYDACEVTYKRFYRNMANIG